MHNYLVTMADRITGECQQIIVRSDCPHGMQEYIDDQVSRGTAEIRLNNPVVIDVDARTARHIPVRHHT